MDTAWCSSHPRYRVAGVDRLQCSALGGSHWVQLIDKRSPVNEGPGQHASSVCLEPAHMVFLRHYQKGNEAEDTRNAQGSCCGGYGASS